MSSRITVIGAALLLVLGGCGPSATPGASGGACAATPAVADDLQGWTPPADPPAVLPVLISNQLGCGQNRVLFSILDLQNRPIGGPDRSVSVAFFNLGRDPGTAIATVPGEFVWAIEEEVGVYVGNVAFPESGRYGAEFRTAEGGAEADVIRMTFDVQPSSSVVKVGDPAPASKTPTLADVGGAVARRSTDDEPLEAFYETSVDAALAAKEPFALIFATPKFCLTAQCGPTLDRIKPFVTRYPTVRFINVEPYKLKLEGGTLQADLGANGQLQPVATTLEWRLINEPVVYVVDREGIVRNVFELIFGDEELTEALEAVA